MPVPMVAVPRDLDASAPSPMPADCASGFVASSSLSMGYGDDDGDGCRSPRSSAATSASTDFAYTPSRRTTSDARESTRAGFRSRAVGSADEKRVTFRATPSVRYFKSTHTVSFGDALDSGDGDQEDPRYAAMRTRRVMRRLNEDCVHEVPVEEDRRRLVAKIADNARQKLEASVRQLLFYNGEDKNTWKRWSRIRPLAATAVTVAGAKPNIWERQYDGDGMHHQVAMTVTLPCGFRELYHVIKSTNRGELDAALLACVSERLESRALVKKIESVAQENDESEEEEPETPTTGSIGVLVRRVMLPRTKLADAAHAWRMGTTTSADELEVVDCEVAPVVTEQRASRVLQLMAAPSSVASNADHAIVGNMLVGYFVQHDALSKQTTLVVLLSRKRKLTKSFSWGPETVSDRLAARMPWIANVLWNYVQRRRFGFHAIAYPDIVYSVEDVQVAEADVTDCPVCEGEFGFLRRRQFCHMCALWVCAKCSRDQDIDADGSGWMTANVNVCLACDNRVSECIYDYDHGARSPGAKIIVSEHQAALTRRSSSLVETWIKMLQQASSEGERQACTDVLETLMGLLSCEEVFGIRLSGLTNGWEDLASDEMHEAVQEVSEMLPIPHVAQHQCLLSHDATRREYALLFDGDSRLPRSPVAVDEKERVRRIQRAGLVDMTPCPPLETLCALACAELQCAISYVSAVADECVMLIAKCGTSTTTRARDDGFDAYTLQSVHPFVLLDMARDLRSRFFTSTTEKQARFYCGVPLLSVDESFVMATFAVIDTSPRKSITTSAYSLFMVFARAARELLIHELGSQRLEPAAVA